MKSKQLIQQTNGLTHAFIHGLFLPQMVSRYAPRLRSPKPDMMYLSGTLQP